MNALKIVDAVRKAGAALTVEDGRLIVRGHGTRLPEPLRQAIQEHKAEVMVALGVPIDQTVAAILQEIRPHLSPALRRLPDDRLLALVNWHIIHAWERAIREAGKQDRAPRTGRASNPGEVVA